jgi:sulfonate transport system substrate-binding protein
VYAILNRNDVSYSTTPQGIMKFADFMYRTGNLKIKPASWKDLFWENLSSKPGS